MAVVRIHDGIESYITEDCAVSVEDLKTMTDAEIEAYFSEESFVEMWGGGVLSDLPHGFGDMTEAAKSLRDRANGDVDDQPRRRHVIM